MKFSDSEYDNELLAQIAKESPTFAALVSGCIEQFKQDFALNAYLVDHEAIWLGSFTDGVIDHTQVQLVVTQDKDQLIDED